MTLSDLLHALRWLWWLPIPATTLLVAVLAEPSHYRAAAEVWIDPSKAPIILGRLNSGLVARGVGLGASERVEALRPKRADALVRVVGRAADGARAVAVTNAVVATVRVTLDQEQEGRHERRRARATTLRTDLNALLTRADALERAAWERAEQQRVAVESIERQTQALAGEEHERWRQDVLEAFRQGRSVSLLPPSSPPRLRLSAPLPPPTPEIGRLGARIRAVEAQLAAVEGAGDEARPDLVVIDPAAQAELIPWLSRGRAAQAGIGGALLGGVFILVAAWVRSEWIEGHRG